MLRVSITALTILSVTVAFTGAFTGCTANGSRSPSSTTGSSRATASTATLPTGSSDAAFSITRALRSNQNPTALLELVTTDGSIASFCQKKADCKCRFNWTEADGTFREADQELADDPEVNQVRCLFTQVSTNATFFDVKVIVTAGDATSNALRVFIGSPNPSLNPTLGSNYVAIQRYMCRDSIRKMHVQGKINYYMNDTLLDPRVWDMGYAFNLYTSSFGLDYGATARGNTAPTGYECPPIPNDSTFSPVFDLKLYSLAAVDLSNPLLTGVATGDDTIYPSDDNKNYTGCVNGTESTCEKFNLNRHDFFLASFMDGTFKIPVCMIHNVSNIASATLNCKVDATKGTPILGSAALADAGQDVVGFAAVPDANQNCPNSNAVKIPAGKKWAKLWRFRASLPIRTIQGVANIGDIGNLFCTTRKKECKSGSSLVTSTGNQTAVDQNDYLNNDTSTVSVCWSVGDSNGTGPNLGPQPSGVLPSGSGFGNCSSTGRIGDNQNPLASYGYAYGAKANPNNTSETNPSPNGSWSKCAGYDGRNCCNDYNDSTQGTSRRPANFTPGGDRCTPSLVGLSSAASDGGSAQDVWLYGNGNRGPCIEADTDASGRLKLSTFPDTLGAFILSSVSIDGNSRFDYMYVVTPTRVTVENLQNPSDPVGQQFIPKRFLPNSPNPVVYGLEAGSDNSSNSGTRTGTFPLCVLQDTK